MKSPRPQGQSPAALSASGGRRPAEGAASRRGRLARRSPKSKQRSGVPAASVPSTGEEDIPWPERVRQWLVSSLTAGYALSFLIHSVGLALCSVVVIEGMVGDDEFTTLLSQAEEGEAVELEQLPDTQFEMAEKDLDATNLPQLQKIESLETPIPQRDFANQLQAEISDRFKAGAGSGRGNLLSVPQAGNAVTQGSFTAWTIPEDPTPDAYYHIVIQIKLPYGTQKYRSSDLQGMVRGTDDYEQRIPWDARCPANSMIPGPDGKPVRLRRNGRLPVEDGVAQLVIAVPPGEKLVKDTIQIRSRKLDEEQTLEIVF